MNVEEVCERFKADQYAVGLTGVEIVDVREGYAKTRLAVEPKHLNAFGIIQGGALFTMADYTFAVAIHAGQEDSIVGIDCHISYHKPVTEGVLFAESQMIAQSRSLVAQNVTITNERGDVIATFYGRGFIRQRSSRQTTSPPLPGEPC
jgi:acyl-CoA thioesterase